MTGRLIATLCAVAAPLAAAALVTDVEVQKEQGRYVIRSDITVDAPRATVFEVLADYDQFEQVSTVFEDSYFIEGDADGGGLIYTRLRDCLLFFCRTIERVETLTLERPHRIVTVVIPERSDVSEGETRWILSDNGGGTSIRHEMEMVPDFWIPPVIGPFMLKRYLQNGGQRAAERLERIANERAAAVLDTGD